MFPVDFSPPKPITTGSSPASQIACFFISNFAGHGLEIIGGIRHLTKSADLFHLEKVV